MKEKILKTNVMRILDQKKIKYRYYTYLHEDDAIAGDEVAKLINKNLDCIFNTLVTRSSHNKNLLYVLSFLF